MKKIISVLLALAMILTFVPMAVFAVSEEYGSVNGDNTDYPDVYPENKIVNMTDEQIDEIVEAALNTMTPDEFYLLCGGTSASRSPRGYGTGYVVGVPRLGIPILRMYDGPQGTISQSGYLTTKQSSEESLASSWDVDLAYEWGAMNASSVRSTAGNTQLGTQYDNCRYPFYQRSRDTLGEDWYLAGKIGTAETKGLQDNHVMAVLKHFAVYSGGTTGKTRIDEQTMHELYLSQFEMAVKEGGASGIMSSYNVINDIQASAHMYVQFKVGREMWGFDGVFMTDWAMGNKEFTVGLGTDLEMGTISRNSKANIEAALEAGMIEWSDVTDCARHYITAIGEMGYLGLCEFAQTEGPDGEKYLAQDVAQTAAIEMPILSDLNARKELLQKNDAVALRAAEEGAVLLKNNGILPLSANSNDSIALIGFGTEHAILGHHSECSYGWLPAMTSPYEEMAKVFGDKVTSYIGWDEMGTPIPAEYFYVDAEGTTNGVSRVGTDPQGNEVNTVDPALNYNTNGRSYLNEEGGNAFPNGSRYTITTYLKAPVSGSYKLRLCGIGGSASNSTITIGDRNTNLSSGVTTYFGTTGTVRTDTGMNIPAGTNVTLEAGQLYRVTTTLNANTALRDGQSLRDLQACLTWEIPGNTDARYAEAVQAAKDNKIVVFFPYNTSTATSLELTTGNQKALMLDCISAAKEAGNKVVVVLTTAMPIVVQDWINDVDAVLEMWLPGQAVGRAVTNLLTGVTNPSGKTALTWPKTANDTQMGVMSSDNPTYVSRYTNNDFSEGIFAGYRWYDSENIAPQYEFGYGLSYTNFEYSDLNVEVDDEAAYNNGYNVSFTVKNTGSVKGTEVAQVYLGAAELENGVYDSDDLNWDASQLANITTRVTIQGSTMPDASNWDNYMFPTIAGPQMAQKQLAAFARIEDLAPGESRTVNVKIEARSLAYWDVNAELNGDGTIYDKWVIAEGERDVYVGASSRDIKLTKTIDVVAKDSALANQVEAPDSAFTNEDFTISVKAPTDVIAVKLVNENGKAIGIKETELIFGEKSNKWNLTTCIGTAGDRVISIMFKTLEDGWVESDVALEIEIKQFADKAIGVKSAEFDSLFATVNEPVGVTIITTGDARKVKITNESGANMGKTLVSKTIANGVTEWKYTTAFGSAGYGKVYTFAAAGSDGVFTDATAKTFIHVTK